MHVRLHELLDEVDLGEALVRRGLDNVEDGDDVLVVEPSEELDLSEGAQALRRQSDARVSAAVLRYTVLCARSQLGSTKDSTHKHAVVERCDFLHGRTWDGVCVFPVSSARDIRERGPSL